LTTPGLAVITRKLEVRNLQFSILMTTLWRHGDFMKLWLGHTVSRFGSRISDDAMVATAVLVLAAQPEQLGWLITLESLPVLAVGLLAGSIADRLPRRPVMVVTDLARVLLLGSIPLAFVLGKLGMGQLYVVALLAGACTVFFDVADQSFLPRLVSRERVAEGNSKLSVSSSVAELGGPALSGAMIQLLSAPITILIDAVSVLFSALMLSLIRVREAAGSSLQAESLGAEPPASNLRASTVTSGFRLVFSNPLLRAMVLHAGTATFFGGFFAAFYWRYAVIELGLGPAVVGVLISTGGISSLVGALTVGRLTRRFGTGATMAGSALLGGLTTLLVPAAALAAVPWMAAALLFSQQILGDACFTVYEVNELSLRQSLVPDEMLGRANAAVRIIVGAALPAGAMVAGFLAGAIGIGPTMLVSALGILAGSLWIILSPVRRLA
jgi:predicted MFS family arabinose efflux permease